MPSRQGRLPPPPTGGGTSSRPLPQLPRDNSPPPPSLPPRPGGRSAPPPSRNRPVSPSPGEQDYMEPDEPRAPPPIQRAVPQKSMPPPPPPQEPEQLVYDDLQDVVTAQPDPDEGETYDACEINEVQQAPPTEEDMYQEPPDETDTGGGPEPIQEMLYEAVADQEPPPPARLPERPKPTPSLPSRPQPPPPPPVDDFQQDTYEAVDESSAPLPPPPPPSNIPKKAPTPQLPRRPEEPVGQGDSEMTYEAIDARPDSPPPLPPPPQPTLKSLPHKPGRDLPKEPSDSDKPDLPGRPQAASKPRKTSTGAGGPQIGQVISPDMLNKGRLKKVSSEESEDKNTSSSTNTGASNGPDVSKLSVIDKIKLMNEGIAPVQKNFGSNVKPGKPPKPTVVVSPLSSPQGNGAPPQIPSTTSIPKKKEPIRPESPVQSPADDWPEEIYDDAQSFEDPLLKNKWYHGNVERRKAETTLKSMGEDGAFLVRESAKGGEKQPYTLVVLYSNHVYNLKIRKRNDRKMAIGEEKEDELAFTDLPELITHHRNNEVILVNVTEHKQNRTLLKKSPDKH